MPPNTLFPAIYGIYAEKLARYHYYVVDQLVRLGLPADVERRSKSQQNAAHNSQNELLRYLMAKNADLCATLISQVYDYRNFGLSDIEDTSTHFARLLEIDTPFRTNHLYLRYISLPVVDPHIELFVEQTTRSPCSASSKGWSVVLSSQYSFSNLVPRENVTLSPPTIFKLPATEKDNPFAWPTLFHEIGHARIAAQLSKMQGGAKEVLNLVKVWRDAPDGIKSVFGVLLGSVPTNWIPKEAALSASATAPSDSPAVLGTT